jgi:hypothetical protein
LAKIFAPADCTGGAEAAAGRVVIDVQPLIAANRTAQTATVGLRCCPGRTAISFQLRLSSIVGTASGANAPQLHMLAGDADHYSGATGVSAALCATCGGLDFALAGSIER